MEDLPEHAAASQWEKGKKGRISVTFGRGGMELRFLGFPPHSIEGTSSHSV